MRETIKNAWRIVEIRKKILYTLGMLLIFRLLCFIPTPGVDTSMIQAVIEQYSIIGFIQSMTGSNFSNYNIMAMGITPYINASIIMQLLCVAIPKLEELNKQGDEGRKKIAQITRYVTVGLGFVQALALTVGMKANATGGFLGLLTIGFCLAAGTALAMWIGERITENGIGNGISLLIFAGIVSNLFNGVASSISTAVAGTMSSWLSVLVIILMLVLMTFAVTYVDLGERRIPLQISKQVKGRRVYGGQNTHMTLKVVSVGVLPLIFAYSLLAFPGTIGALVAPNSGFTTWCNTYLQSGSWVYMLISALLIVGFTFFYSAISFDPNKQAKQLIEQGATIPGQRGKNIRDYLARTTNRLNLFAALFLAVLAVVPTLLTSWVTSLPFAASSILIAVSVSLETMRTMEGEMSIRGIETDKDNGFM